MERISVLIIEDNPLTAQDLAEILEENGMDVAGTCYAAEDAREFLESHEPDVLLVDIKLRGSMTGIDLVKQLRKHVPVIYLTSNSDRETVDEALETRPASFLTKPFDDKDVVIAIELAFKSFNENLTTANGSPHIFLKHNSQYEKVLTRDIRYLEADGSYLKVMTTKKDFLLTGSLSSFCEQMHGQSVLRVHRSFAVNVDHISSLGSDFLYIDEVKIPVGRTYRDELKQLARKFN